MGIEVVGAGRPPCPEPDLFLGTCGNCSCELKSTTIEDDGGTSVPPRPPVPPLTSSSRTRKYLDVYSVDKHYQKPPSPAYKHWTTTCPNCGYRVGMSPRWLNPEYENSADETTPVSVTGCLTLLLCGGGFMAGLVWFWVRALL